MRSAFVVGDREDFVDDHRLHIAQQFTAFLRCKQDVERFGGRDQDMRRQSQHALAVSGRRVAGTDEGANLRHQQTALACQLRDFRQGTLQVLLDVIAEGLERGDVDDFNLVLQGAADRFADESINASKEGGERFAGTGRSGDQGRAPGNNVRPSLLLRLSGSAELLDEPLLD